MESIWLVLPLGLLAGALTTLAGIGGGLIITLVLAAAWGPHFALAVTAPALLLGNAHRGWIFRRHVDRRCARRLVGPGLVGAVVGGALAIDLPASWLRGLLVGVTAFAVLRPRGWRRAAAGPVWLGLGGLLGGVLTATTGGGGLVFTPLVLGAGLRGVAFVATGAVVAVAIHTARIGAYVATGLLDWTPLRVALGLGLAILIGNELGRRLRPRVGEATCHRLTWVVLIGSVTLALVGLGR